MPRYSFHTKRGQLTQLDQEGVELQDLAEAINEAKPTLRFARNRVGHHLVRDDRRQRKRPGGGSEPGRRVTLRPPPCRQEAVGSTSISGNSALGPTRRGHALSRMLDPAN